MAASSSILCRYCGSSTEDIKWAPLKCKVCLQLVHLSCIRSERPPACYGDRFFDFTCRFCSGTGSEICIREHMTWSQAVHLAVYHILMDGQGRKGYLHYADNIGAFINSNWKRIIPYRKKTTAWINTIAGVLSSNCPAVFKSGTEELKEPGWWTLVNVRPPDPSQTTSVKGGMKRQVAQQPQQVQHTPQTLPSTQGLSTSTPQQQPSLLSAIESKRAKMEPINYTEEHSVGIDDKIEKRHMLGQLSSGDSSRLKLLTERQEKIVIKYLSKMEDVVRTNTHASQLLAKLKLRQRYRQYKVPLFDIDAIVGKMLLSAKGYQLDPNDDSSIIPIKYSDEEMLVNAENRYKEEQETSGPANLRYFRDVPLDYLRKGPILSSPLPPSHSNFQSRTVGCSYRLETFVSPYTKRVLKPIIWRDHEVRPKRTKLLKDIRNHHAGSHTPCNPSDTSDDDSIVYCYLREHHVLAVNILIANFFWSGVNIAECLEYPDYTVVALYKKLVVGCGFLTPDVRVNEAYISFFLVHPDWQGCGIGSFMLYHLIQTCMGKDITLHVSVDNNPAIFLYQKFGFKSEQLCLDFYERYYPPDFHYSKHACFMRLKR